LLNGNNQTLLNFFLTMAAYIPEENLAQFFQTVGTMRTTEIVLSGSGDRFTFSRGPAGPLFITRAVATNITERFRLYCETRGNGNIFGFGIVIRRGRVSAPPERTFISTPTHIQRFLNQMADLGNVILDSVEVARMQYRSRPRTTPIPLPGPLPTLPPTGPVAPTLPPAAPTLPPTVPTTPVLNSPPQVPLPDIVNLVSETESLSSTSPSYSSPTPEEREPGDSSTSPQANIFGTVSDDSDSDIYN
jgi:hypothetical protein